MYIRTYTYTYVALQYVRNTANNIIILNACILVSYLVEHTCTYSHIPALSSLECHPSKPWKGYGFPLYKIKIQ